MKRSLEIYPAYDKIMAQNGYEYHKDLQDRPDPNDSTKKPILRVSLIFEDELVRVEQELKELEEEMVRLEEEKVQAAENKIKGGIFKFFTKKKAPEGETPKKMNPMAKAIIHKQMQMLSKMKQQDRMKNAFMSKISQKQTEMDEESSDEEMQMEHKLCILREALKHRGKMFQTQKMREEDEGAPKDRADGSSEESEIETEKISMAAMKALPEKKKKKDKPKKVEAAPMAGMFAGLKKPKIEVEKVDGEAGKVEKIADDKD